MAEARCLPHSLNGLAVYAETDSDPAAQRHRDGGHVAPLQGYLPTSGKSLRRSILSNPAGRGHRAEESVHRLSTAG